MALLQFECIDDADAGATHVYVQRVPASDAAHEVKGAPRAQARVHQEVLLDRSRRARRQRVVLLASLGAPAGQCGDGLDGHVRCARGQLIDQI